MNYGIRKTHELLASFEAQLPVRYRAEQVKRDVFRRTSQLKRDGYAEDVAFAKALIEFRFKV